MARPNFEKLQYQLSEKLADDIWYIVQNWDEFAKNTVGKQIVRSADSIGANIAEGEGRYNYQDNKRFLTLRRMNRGGFSVSASALTSTESPL